MTVHKYKIIREMFLSSESKTYLLTDVVYDIVRLHVRIRYFETEQNEIRPNSLCDVHRNRNHQVHLETNTCVPRCSLSS